MLIKLKDGSFINPMKVNAIGHAPAKKAVKAVKPVTKLIAGKVVIIKEQVHALPAVKEFWVAHVEHLQFKLEEKDLKLIVDASNK